MQKSTPLDHLRRDGGGDMQQPDGPGAAELMDSVVQDLEGAQQQGYSGEDYPQEPGFDPRMGGGGGDRPGPRYDHFAPGPPPGYGPPQGMPGGPMPGYGAPPPGVRMHPGMGGPGGPPLENATFSEKIMGQVKEPLLVSVLVVILSSSQVNQLIARFLPMAAANPFIGLLVRAVIAGLAFWMLRRFIPK